MPTKAKAHSPIGQAAPERALRADAKRNYELLVATAEAVFAQHGAESSLDDIAKRAGVGIGTLYRHFPTRDDLIAKVLTDGSAAMMARATALLASTAPADAFIEWLRELVRFNTTYRGLTTALATSFLNKSDTSLCATCVDMTAAGRALLVRAQDAGEIRADADIQEVILSTQAAAWVGEQTKDPSASDRMLAILFDGLRVVAKPAKRAAAR